MLFDYSILVQFLLEGFWLYVLPSGPNVVWENSEYANSLFFVCARLSCCTSWHLLYFLRQLPYCLLEHVMQIFIFINALAGLCLTISNVHWKVVVRGSIVAGKMGKIRYASDTMHDNKQLCGCPGVSKFRLPSIFSQPIQSGPWLIVRPPCSTLFVQTKPFWRNEVSCDLYRYENYSQLVHFLNIYCHNVLQIVKNWWNGHLELRWGVQVRMVLSLRKMVLLGQVFDLHHMRQGFC